MEAHQHLMNKISQGLIAVNHLRDRLIKIRNDKTINNAKRSIQSRQIEEEIELFLELILSNEQLIYKIQTEEILKSQELKNKTANILIQNEGEIYNNYNHLISIENENLSICENAEHSVASCKIKTEISDNKTIITDSHNLSKLKFENDISAKNSPSSYNSEEMNGSELPDIRKYVLGDNQKISETSSDEENDTNCWENENYDFTCNEKPDGDINHDEVFGDNVIDEVIKDSLFEMGKESKSDESHAEEHDAESSSNGEETDIDKFILSESLKEHQNEKISEINSKREYLNPILVQPGSSTIFINHFRKIMKNNMSKILTNHQITEIKVDWIPKVYKDNTPPQSDLLNDLCQINSTLLSDVIQDIFDIMEEMYDKNEPIHKYAIRKNIPITECLMIPRASRNNRKIYFLYYRILMCNNKKSFMEIYEKFEELIINEFINPIFFEIKDNIINKLSDQPYLLNRAFSLEQRYEKMGVVLDSSAKFYSEKDPNENIIQTMLLEECQNENMAWDHFQEEELELCKKELEKSDGSREDMLNTVFNGDNSDVEESKNSNSSISPVE